MQRAFFYNTSLALLVTAAAIVTQGQTPRIAPAAYSSNAKVNYVRTWVAKAPRTDASTILTAASIDSFLVTTQYFDGLGNLVQTVAKQQSPLGKDIVTPVVYDEFGRQQYTYLPFAANTTGSNSSLTDGFFKLNPFQQDSTFSKVQYPGESFYYGQFFFEAAPLSRPLENFAPGDNWAGTSWQASASNRRSVKTSYLLNTLSDSVRVWNVTSTISSAPTTSLIYSANQLHKTVSADEHLNQVIEYKDRTDKVILKKVQVAASPATGHYGWACTYYIYNDLGQLRFVLQPKAVETLLQLGNWTISNTIRDELCFYYGYDSRNRMNIKKVPGAGEVYMVHDARDRLVMTQDANLRTGTEKWLITLYDSLNRQIQTGLVNNSSIGSKTFATHGTDANSSIAYPFSVTSIPGSGYEELTQTGYDNYDNIPGGSGLTGTLNTTHITSSNFFTTYNAAPEYAQQIVQSMQVRSLVTWTKSKVLGTSSTYLYSVSFYDDDGRVVQVKSTNLSAGTDVATTQYSFSGHVRRTHLAHHKNGTNSNNWYILTKNTYDAVNRLTSISKRVNNSTTSFTTDKIISRLSYDELGHVKKKMLSNLDSLEYDYNIRGWLLGANRDYAKSTASTTHLFGFDLAYDKTSITPAGGSSIGSFNTGQYNGNMAGTVWKSTGDDEVRKYDFSYDAMNRLTGADFNQYTSASFNKNAGLDFSVAGLSYDLNGNILFQKQRGWKVGGSFTMDSLSYTYESTSNKLKNVIDLQNDINTTLGDFRSSSAYMTSLGIKTNAATDYAYDGNGNLTKDLNKDISTGGISYNHLNLPTLISVTGKGTIDYTHDASGIKLKKVVTEGASVITTLFLFGTFKNDTLEFLPHEEGRIRPIGDTAFTYDYFVKDHLGNVRMVLTDQQQTDIYLHASMETGSATAEDSLYYNLSQTRTALPALYPSDNYNNPNPNDYVAKVRGDGNIIGPAIVLKVMAGDKFNIRVSSWYNLNGATPQTPSSPLIDLITALVNGLGNEPGSKANASTLSSSGILNLGAVSYYSSHNNSDSTTKPKAFVNWVLFDEQFNYVSNSSGFEQVGSSNMFTVHLLNNLVLNKNGYLYIYVSNETPNIDVFFDNLQVTHIRGPLIEETHYYPFGLTIAGISSKTLGSNYVKNRLKFNSGTELSDDFNVNLYETHFRSLDPQIGRLWQIDPMADLAHEYSPFTYANNNPVTFNDPLGLFADSTGTPGFSPDNPKTLKEVTVTARREVPSQFLPYLSFRNNRPYSLASARDWPISLSRDRTNDLLDSWAMGLGAENRVYLPNHAMTKRLKNAHQVHLARVFFYKKYLKNFLNGQSLKGASVTNYNGKFGLPGFVFAGTDIVEQFVGSFDVNIYVDDKGENLLFFVGNTTSSTSAFYRMADAHDRVPGQLTARGNMSQVFIWQEPVTRSGFMDIISPRPPSPSPTTLISGTPFQ